MHLTAVDKDSVDVLSNIINHIPRLTVCLTGHGNGNGAVKTSIASSRRQLLLQFDSIVHMTSPPQNFRRIENIL